MLVDDLNNKIHKNNSYELFINATPFPYIILDNFLDESLAISLSRNFPSLTSMDKQYNGINERKAEHSNFNILTQEFNLLKQKVYDTDFVKLIEQITGINGLLLIDDNFGFGLHQGGNGSYLDIHIDYNLHPIEKKHRRLNLILFLNDNWKQEWGGYLEFWNENATKCVKRIEPKFNRCVLFICNDKSYHGYSKVICPEKVTRKSFYLYFFTQEQKNVLFHDTKFKPVPNDVLSKKIKVIIKENIKNFIKRILYHTRLIKFFK